MVDDVKVPATHIIGKENEGFKCIMVNFNHERWGFIAQSNRFSRVCLEEAFRYAMKRKTFGKRLIDHPVIRWKIAEMARQIETTHAMLEHITYQVNMCPKRPDADSVLLGSCVRCPRITLTLIGWKLCTMSKDEAATRLGGTCALIKAHATKVFEYCAREAAQIFGGASYVRGGQGEKVERLYRDVRAYAIPGGSEEILLDLGVRQAMKNM
jgi:alkylation response protein AidB-like acyl-CoA dehydrogenase